jgi:DNA polymerase I
MSVALRNEPPLIVTSSYIRDLEARDKEIKTPKFKNERKFGYIITNEVDLRRLKKYIKKLNPIVRCFDTETQSDDNSIRKARMVGLSISFGRAKHHNYYIPCGHTVLEPYGEQVSVEKTVEFAKWFLLERNTVLGAHNMSYDFHILANHELHLIKHTRRHGIRLYDTMIASWIVDENLLKGLKFQAKLRLKDKPYVPEMKEYNDTVATVPNDVKRKHGLKANQKATIDLVAIDIAGDYAINDSIAVFDLMEVYEARMWNEQPLYDRFHEFEMQYFYTAYKMERRGTKLNLPLLKKYKKDITKHIAELEDKLYSMVGYSFSVNSPKALPKLFYEELGFPVVKYTDPKKNKSGTSNPSTDKEALEMLLDFRRTLLNPMLEELKQAEKKLKKKETSKVLKKKIERLKRETNELERKLQIVQLVVDVRLLKHLDSNFITGLLEKQINGIIYPRFNQAGTVTGRLSSSDPNGQNIKWCVL